IGTQGLVSVQGDRSNRNDPTYTPPPYQPIGNVLVQPDGKILLVASQAYVDGFSTLNLGNVALVRRYMPDGTPDSGFQDSTDPVFDPPPYAHGIIFTGAALAPDGKLVSSADVWSSNSASAPHWSGVARYFTAAGSVTINPTPGSGNGGGN